VSLVESVDLIEQVKATLLKVKALFARYAYNKRKYRKRKSDT